MTDSPSWLIAKLDELLALPMENEVVEFKQAKESFDIRKLGTYLSALANEANLLGKAEGWLVLGVDNSRRIVGTNLYQGLERRENIKHEIARNTTERTTFTDVFEVNHPAGRVLMLRVPPAPRGLPVAYNGHRYAREGESLGALSYEEEQRIRSQSSMEDWSAVVVPEATVNDLDSEAILSARARFATRHPQIAGECRQWDDMTFLNRARLAKSGAITRTALLLLGKEESDTLLPSANLKISWILMEHTGERRDYHHFGLPFLTSVEKVLQKIRNLKYRYLQAGTLFPEELDTYDPYIIREALHNCIAHRDYTISGRISVSEHPDSLVFANVGSFIPGNIENVIESKAPEDRYRNPFLVEAMENLNMIEYVGHGIQRMFSTQRKRFFPLPDYDFSQSDRVILTITGKVLDLGYVRLLADNPDLSLSVIVLLDKVQKRKPITKDEAVYLRRKGFIEGRHPKYYIAKSIAAQTGQKIEYSRSKGLQRHTYENMIVEAIREHKSLSRQDIDLLLKDALSDLYDEKQRIHKVANIIKSMRTKGVIENIGTNRNSKWVIPGDE